VLGFFDSLLGSAGTQFWERHPASVSTMAIVAPPIGGKVALNHPGLVVVPTVRSVTL
jgi:hypothetical protein